MAAVTICSDFGAQEKHVTVSIFSPSICHEKMGPPSWSDGTVMTYIYIYSYIYLMIYMGVSWYTHTHTHTHTYMFYFSEELWLIHMLMNFLVAIQTPRWHHGPALKKSVLLASQNVYLFILWGKDVEEMYYSLNFHL